MRFIMNQKLKVILFLVFTIFLLIGLRILVSAQNTNSQIDENSKVENLQNQQNEDSEKIKKLLETTQDLKTQNAVLTKSLDTLSVIIFSFVGLISLILLLGTGTSLWSWNTDRKRLNDVYKVAEDKEKENTRRENIFHERQDYLYEFSKERERIFHQRQDSLFELSTKREKTLQERQDQLFELSLSREKESSERDRHIFGQSTETLTLVNQTLELARDASERASKALEERLNRQHNDLEQDAIDLLDEAKAYKNPKVLVEDSNFRSNLQTLASEVTALQTNQNILDKEVSLNPHCCFIKAMESHLNQHFKPAIKYWKKSESNDKAQIPLRIMSLYWIGYEQNNLGEFENGAASFEKASSIATGHMKYELERIRIESKFFDYPKFSTRKILPEMESLYEQIKKENESEEFQKVRSGIAGTLGNIYYQLGNELSSENKENESKEYYKKAKEIFFEAPVKNKWIWFGYGESCYKLGEYEEAEKQLLDKVKNEAEFEYSTRLEPRTKVLGQTTVLICSIRIKSLHDNVRPLINLITATLGNVDKRLTVYSQFQRRNVSKRKFNEDLNKLMEEFELGSSDD